MIKPFLYTSEPPRIRYDHRFSGSPRICASRKSPGTLFLGNMADGECGLKFTRRTRHEDFIIVADHSSRAQFPKQVTERLIPRNEYKMSQWYPH